MMTRTTTLTVVDTSRAAYFFVAALVFSLALAAVHPWYSVDYFTFLFVDNRHMLLAKGEMASGRYLNAVVILICQKLGLDPMRDYPIFVVAGAAATALFLRRAYLDFLRLPASLLWFTFFCATFLFGGAMLDLLSYREVPHHTPAMFAAAYPFLAADGIRSRLLRIAVRALSVAATFAVYQPAVSMLLLLVMLRAMCRTSNGEPARQVVTELVEFAVGVAAGTIAYFAVKAGVDTTTRFRVSRQMMDFRDMAALRTRVTEHGKAILSLFATPSELYKWAHVGIGLILALTACLWRAAQARRLIAAAGLGVLVVVLMQNPMNFAMKDYWPSPRSSFYWAMVPGLLLAYAFAGAKPGRWRTAGTYVMAGLATIYASAAVVLLNDGYELRKRDYALAQAIASEVRAVPELAGATQIRMPKDWGMLQPAYYRGVDGLAFDYGTPALIPSWTVGPFLEWATGLHLSYAGASVCSTPTNIPRIRVSKVDGMVNVCFE